MDIIEKIKERFEVLKELDDYADLQNIIYWPGRVRDENGEFSTKRLVKKYELGKPVSQNEIKKFEQKHGFKLPEAFKKFISEFGDGGVGPGHVLFNLQEIDEIIDNSLPKDHYDKSFPFEERIHYDEYDEWLKQEFGDDTFEDEYYWAPQGTIPLVSEGCNIYYILIINGSERGHVWCADVGDYPYYPFDEKYCPYINKSRVDFAEYYLNWIEREIEKISKMQRERDEKFPSLIEKFKKWWPTNPWDSYDRWRDGRPDIRDINLFMGTTQEKLMLLNNRALLRDIWMEMGFIKEKLPIDFIVD